MPFSVFQVLFKANLIFKDFSRQSCIFKPKRTRVNPEDRFSHVKAHNMMTGTGRWIVTGNVQLHLYCEMVTKL